MIVWSLCYYYLNWLLKNTFCSSIFFLCMNGTSNKFLFFSNINNHLTTQKTVILYFPAEDLGRIWSKRFPQPNWGHINELFISKMASTPQCQQPVSSTCHPRTILRVLNGCVCFYKHCLVVLNMLLFVFPYLTVCLVFLLLNEIFLFDLKF